MKKIELSADALDLLFEVAKSTIAKSEERPLLNYIKIEVTETTLTAVAVDGYRLSRFSLQHKQEVEPFSCYIKPFIIPKTLDTASIEVTESAAIITLHCCGYDLAYSFIQPKGGGFPDSAQLIPNTDEALEVAFNARMLAEVLKPFSKCADRHNLVKFSFCRSNDGINKVTAALLTNCGDDMKIQTMLLPIRMAGGRGNE